MLFVWQGREWQRRLAFRAYWEEQAVKVRPAEQQAVQRAEKRNQRLDLGFQSGQQACGCCLHTGFDLLCNLLYPRLAYDQVQSQRPP